MNFPRNFSTSAHYKSCAKKQYLMAEKSNCVKSRKTLPLKDFASFLDENLLIRSNNYDKHLQILQFTIISVKNSGKVVPIWDGL